MLLGESGAGKATLVNRLAGVPLLATGAVRAGDAKGRHTTTARHLVPLPGGGVVIDTPGIRELGIAEAGEGVERAFADVAVLARECRFADCRHAGEPGCAVAGSERERRARGRRGARMAREAQAERRRRRGPADR